MRSHREWRYSITAALVLVTGLFLGSTASGVSAQEAVEGKSARATLRETTDKVLVVIEEARDYVDEDPERYYAAVHEVLDPIVDFRGFARGVMGEYATGARYRGLDEAGRDQLRDQLERFTETMRVGLVRTYSKGLLAFGGSRVELDDDEDSDDSPTRATLRQLIYSDATQPYVVVYLMARDKSGAWKMRNLVVENVNLGQIYRSQFESAARRYDGDLDKVIANWTVESAAD
ncbi:ABC transporter substrate-binding protein [Congregibacter variabilis]|uniref:ABC transporter substrate-binding protein n=1 Tax=Congregibacter variabilis TaxID=3081200 RepID=A0ABZ0IA72_9GAMM|nr:ABC transporter substrate-binding protein [Congregibacter sp. IMCC43200]